MVQLRQLEHVNSTPTHRTPGTDRLYDEFLEHGGEWERISRVERFRAPLHIEAIATDSVLLRQRYVRVLEHMPDLTLKRAVDFLCSQLQFFDQLEFSPGYDNDAHRFFLIFFDGEHQVGMLTLRIYDNLIVPHEAIEQCLDQLCRVSRLANPAR